MERWNTSRALRVWGREQKIEGRYVIATSEKDLGVLEAVAKYKELADVESGFRQLKDVMAMRPIYAGPNHGEGAHFRRGTGSFGSAITQS